MRARQTVIQANCRVCGKEFLGRCGGLHGHKGVYCSWVCSGKGRLGQKTVRSAQTVHISRGYRFLRNPLKPSRWKQEHRLVAEKALGRLLKTDETVHHINGDKLDNRNSNLLICSRSYHASLEKRMADLFKREHFGEGTKNSLHS